MAAHLQQNLCELDVPMLVMHGEKDKVVAAAGSELLLKSNKNADKKGVLFQNCFHLVSCDYSCAEAARVATEWLKSKM